MTWLKKFILLLSFAFCFALVPAQDKLTETSSLIKQKLTDLRVNSAVVTEQLITLSENLKISQQEALELKEQSMSLSSSLMNINKQLNNCYETIETQKSRIKFLWKVSVICLVILAMRTLLMILGFIVYAKGIHLPRWLDILI